VDVPIATPSTGRVTAEVEVTPAQLVDPRKFHATNLLYSYASQAAVDALRREGKCNKNDWKLSKDLRSRLNLKI
jgi:hypothetical protein